MAEVKGQFKDGAVVDTNIEYPVLVGGKDGSGNAQTLRVTTTGAITTGGATHDSAVVAEGPQEMLEAAQIDGSVLPNAVNAEGDAVRPKASQEGVSITTLAIEDGSDTPIVAHDTAIGSGFGGAAVVIGHEAAQVDGSALPNAVNAEGDVVRPKASQEGVSLTTITHEDGSDTPVVKHDTAVGSGFGASTLVQGIEAAQIDGSVLPNAVTAEGDIVRPKASQEGVGIVTIAQEDGSDTPVIPHDTAIGSGFGGSTVMQGVEAKDFDGSALPNPVGAEGDAVRPAASLSGISYTMITGEDGSSTPVVDHDTPIGTGLGVGTVIQGLESKDFDGSVLPNVVTAEGDAVRAAGSLYGVQYVMPVSEDGSQSPYDSINNALNVQEIAPAIDRYQTVEIQAATATAATETVIGGEINVAQYNTITIFWDFTINTVTAHYIIPKFLRVAGGDEHAFMEWSTSADKERTPIRFKLTASAKVYATIGVTGIPIVKIFEDTDGSVGSDVVQVGYSLSNN